MLRCEVGKGKFSKKVSIKVIVFGHVGNVRSIIGNNFRLGDTETRRSNIKIGKIVEGSSSELEIGWSRGIDGV